MGTIPGECDRIINVAVHPHGRGDNLLAAERYQTAYGSPPRAWGQCHRFRRRFPHPRFTPTGVGTMLPRTPRQPCQTVHPHGRGDNFTRPAASSTARGSPPRAWGQLLVAYKLSDEYRFTPTGVGTIRAVERDQNRHTVHPHGRGDNRERDYPVVVTPGSPPRAWGQCADAER